MLSKEQRDTLVIGHEKLAWSVVHKFANEAKKRGIDVDDLHQAAMMKLSWLATYYDPSMGIPFTPWAKAKVRIAVSYEFTRLSNIIWVNPVAFSKKLAGSDRAECARRESSRIRWSLDMNVTDGSGDMVRDIIEGRDATPEDAAISSERREGVLSALRLLPPRTRDIVLASVEHGWGSQKIKSVQYGISRTRVQQIYADGIKRLARVLSRFND